MRWRGIIFDLDGTLADTLATIANALNCGLRALDLPTHSLNEVSKMVGEGVSVLCRRALSEDRGDLHEELIREVRKAYDAEPLLHARLYPGMKDALRELEDMGIAMAVISNKPDALTRITVQGLGVAEHFPVILGFGEDFPRKPDSSSTAWVLDRLGVAVEEALFVGDTAVDMSTARNASVAAIAVTWGFRGLEEMLPYEPRFVVNHPGEIVDIVRGTPRGST